MYIGLIMKINFALKPLLLTILCMSVIFSVTTPTLSVPADAQSILEPNNPQLIYQISVLSQAGNSTDSVPVIIVLKQTTKERASDSIATIEVNRAAIARIQQAFIQRHQAAFQQYSGTTVVVPMIFGRLQRKNLKTLLSDTSIATIYEDITFKPSLYESTALIGSTTVNTLGYDGTGTTVAILDTGVSSTHPFLAGKVVDEACFSTYSLFDGSYSLCPSGVSYSTSFGSGSPCSAFTISIYCLHGTHVAGIVSGVRVTSPKGSLVGVAPGSQIISIKVFSALNSIINSDICGTTSTGYCLVAYSSDILRALDWVYINRTRIWWNTLAAVNLSLGSDNFATACNSSPHKAYIDQLRLAGIATIVASGNDSLTNGLSEPACVSSAISVGASTTNSALSDVHHPQNSDEIAFFSNAPSGSMNTPDASGDRLLDFVAPGFSIYSSVTNPLDSYSSLYGTSMAAPHVAGAWAILKGINPSASVSSISSTLRNSGIPITDNRTLNTFSVPRISLPQAVVEALASVTPTSTVTTRPTRTRVPSDTPTITRTISPTLTSSNTPTQSGTFTPSLTFTITFTASITRTSSRTPTRTRTPSRTRIPSRTRTFTKTRTRTPWFHTRTPFWIPTKVPTKLP